MVAPLNEVFAAISASVRKLTANTHSFAVSGQAPRVAGPATAPTGATTTKARAKRKATRGGGRRG